MQIQIFMQGFLNKWSKAKLLSPDNDKHGIDILKDTPFASDQMLECTLTQVRSAHKTAVLYTI